VPRSEVVERVTYTVRIERDEAGAWVARVPQVPGCHTYGRSLRQAKRRIREALALWVDDADRAELTFDVRLPRETARSVAKARSVREAADRAQRDALEVTRRTATDLTRSLRLSVRDTAELLGVSHQRIQQLLMPPRRTRSTPSSRRP
jgi:predicted RNase H-like HicB family nuclease